jgi:hypothetical protein
VGVAICKKLVFDEAAGRRKRRNGERWAVWQGWWNEKVRRRAEIRRGLNERKEEASTGEQKQGDEVEKEDAPHELRIHLLFAQLEPRDAVDSLPRSICRKNGNRSAETAGTVTAMKLRMVRRRRRQHLQMW